MLAHDLAAHSITRFQDNYFLGVSGSLYRGDTEIYDQLDGNRLRFARMSPDVNLDVDYLFVAGGGEAVKSDAAGNVTKWGIDPPADGFTAAKVPTQIKLIELFEDNTVWDTNGVATKLDDPSNFIEGVKSLKLRQGPSETSRVWQDISAIDLTDYGGGIDSPDEDFIAVWISLTEPDGLDYMEIAFKVGASTFDSDGNATDLYTFTIQQGEDAAEILGIANFIGEDEIALENEKKRDPGAVTEAELPTGIPRETRLTHQRGMSRNRVRRSPSTWVRYKLPKSLFDRSGELADSWENITGIRLTIHTNSLQTSTPFDANFDEMLLKGSAGLQGKYKYLITYANSTTTHRSNPNETPVEVEEVERQGIQLSDLPTTSPDPQVDTVEIWRTVGDGFLYFKAGEVALGTDTFLDEVADYEGMDSSTDDVLENEELTFDHARPPDTISDCLGPVRGRMWAIHEGKLYYSAKGIPEAMGNFIIVTENDEPAQRVVFWNGNIYFFTESRIFRIDGTDEPFIPREVQGAPGTIQPHTVVPSSGGILYQAEDGVRLFDGVRSTPVISAPIAPVFDKEGFEGFSYFEGLVAAASPGEYFVSDGTETFALSADGAWRTLGIGCNALYYDAEEQKIVAGALSKTLLLEDESALTDDGVAIPVDWQTQNLRHDTSQEAVIKRVHIDLITRGETLSPKVLLDNDVLVMPLLTAAERQVIELPIDAPARSVGLRLTGAVSDHVEVFDVTIVDHLGAA